MTTRHNDDDSHGSSNRHSACLADLQQQGVHELELLCEKRDIERSHSSGRQDLVLALLNDYARDDHRIEGGGILEVLPDGFGFLRSATYSYTPGPDDVYVSPAQIRRFQLRTGHCLEGELRPPKGTEKYFAMMRVTSVDKASPDERPAVLPFEILEAELPSEPLASAVTELAGLQKGHRCLLIVDPLSRTTPFLVEAARGIRAAHPDTHILAMQIDQPPEEVTWLRREIGDDCNVVSSTFAETSARLVHTAEIAHERCCRLVEQGHDVVILLDSLTGLARAHDIESAPSGRLAPGGLDALGVVKTKRFLATARDVADGGSLTIVALTHDGKGSRIDTAVLESVVKHASQVIELT